MERAYSADTVARAVEAIYAAALDHVDLSLFTQGLSVAFDAPQSSLLTLGGAPQSVSWHGFDPAAQIDYHDYYHAIDPWLAAGMRLPRDHAVAVERFVPHHDFIGSEFYQDYMRHHDSAHCLGLIFDAADVRYSLTVMRTAGQRGFDRQSETLLDQLLPHIRRALLTFERLKHSAAELTRLGRVAANGSEVVVIVNAALQVRWMSRPDLDAVAGASVVRDGGGVRLVFDRADQHAGLRTAVALACKDHRPQSSPVAIGSTGWLFVDPGEDIGTERVAELRLPASNPDQIRARAQQRYGLTEAETLLCAGLLAGRTVQDHADQLGISVWTVRTHLRSVFAKTDLHRQADLVALLHRIA